MDFNSIYTTVQDLMTKDVVKLLGALLVFVVGWILALIVSNTIKKMFKSSGLSKNFSKWFFGGSKGSDATAEKWVGRIFYYSIFAITVVAFLQVLGIPVIEDSMNDFVSLVVGHISSLITPVILIAIAWAVATLLRFIIISFSQQMKVDERLKSQIADSDVIESGKVKVSTAFAEAVYWLVFLLFLPTILESLSLQELMQPINEMLNTLLGFLPHLFGAFIIFLVGWIGAKIVQKILVNLLGSVGLDKISQRVGMETILGEKKLSDLVGIIAYVLILIPVLISSLNALKLEAITRPASEMLNDILKAFPSIFAAALVLFIAYIVARIVSELASNFLSSIGFDNVLTNIGFSTELKKTEQTPSQIVGAIVLLGIMLFATIEAFNLLGFETLAGMVNQFTVFGGEILLGLIIFSLGLYVANFAARAIVNSSLAHASLLAVMARVAIIALVGAMALREVGIGDEIVNITFAIVLGAIAVAFGLSFGLGGKATAEKYIQKLVNFMASKDVQK